MALPFNNAFVLVQEPPDIQGVPIARSLNSVRILPQFGVVDAVLEEEVISSGDEKPGAAGVALADSASAQLVVDTPALMLVRTHHIEIPSSATLSPS